jgi:hypothetical protein
MKNRLFARVVFAAVLAAICAGAATTSAQPIDKRTFFTFNGPVAIPGVTLPAGKYLFRLADTPSRSVIQVLSGDGKTSYAMFFAFRAERRDASAKPEVRFMETAVDMPSAIDTWWYPAQRSGYEFVYPKEQARLLAKGTGRSVLFTEEPFSPKAPPAEVARVEPSGKTTAVVAEPVIEPTGAGAVEVGEIASPTIQLAEAAQPSLPKTGSAIPLVAFGGMLLLLGGVLSATWRQTHG